MKYLIPLLSPFLFAANAEALSLACVTEFPTTSFFGETQGDELVVNVIHHHGTKFMPIHTGTVTPNDLPELKAKARDLEKLGALYELRYELKDCQRFDGEILSCSGGKEAEINGAKVKPFSISTKRVVTEFEELKFEQIEVSLLLDIDQTTRSFSMKYEKGECYLNEKARKLRKKYL